MTIDWDVFNSQQPSETRSSMPRYYTSALFAEFEKKAKSLEEELNSKLDNEFSDCDMQNFSIKFVEPAEQKNRVTYKLVASCI